jgi:nicotinate phosphoribosyltransferase
MAAGYFHRGLADTDACCEMFVRRLPQPRNYLVACGVDEALEELAALRFSRDQIDYLRQLPGLRDAMDDAFADYLAGFRFSGDVAAVAEGTPMFAGEPFLRVEAPIIEAQIAETYLLSCINHATTIASKAARIVEAARGRQVLEFGTRRTHPDAAVDAARAAYLVGAAGTSNVEAGMRYGIPVMGTAAHMWTMTHDNEEQAFANYVETFPGAAILLIDTYDTVRGAERAARIAGEKLRGVRLDSGDLGALSREVRRVLDESGCEHTRIVASGDLEEHSIDALLSSGAPIDIFGVGTELATSRDAPALGGVYKVVQFTRAGRVVPIAKFSSGKASYPGPHQVFRRFDGGETPLGDRLALAHEPVPDGHRALLEPCVEQGRVVRRVALEQARSHAVAAIAALPAPLRALEPAAPYPVVVSDPLQALVDEVHGRDR